MKRTLLPVLMTLLGTLAASREIKPTLQSVEWLSGCWEMNTKGRVVSESWMKPAGNMMMGVARTVEDGKVLEYEFVRIVREDDGSIIYIAKPSGQEEASFRMVKLDGRSLVFENLRHGFPQRIMYTRHTPDSLIARIEGTMNGKERGVDFTYRKVRCDETVVAWWLRPIVFPTLCSAYLASLSGTLYCRAESVADHSSG